jgi:hypothetical protein
MFENGIHDKKCGQINLFNKWFLQVEKATKVWTAGTALEMESSRNMGQ